MSTVSKLREKSESKKRKRHIAEQFEVQISNKKIAKEEYLDVFELILEPESR